MSTTEDQVDFHDLLEEAPPARSRREAKEPRKKPEKAAKSARGNKPGEVAWPSPVKPTVMLLPAKVRLAASRRTIRRKATMVVGGALAVTIIGATVCGLVAASAEGKYDDSVARGATQETFIDSNVDVTGYYAKYLDMRTAATDVFAKDASYAKVLDNIQDKLPDEVDIKTFARNAEADSCPTITPFTESNALWCVTVVGNAPDMDSVRSAVEKLSAAGETMVVVDPYVAKSERSEDNKGIQFTMTVGYTDQALANKTADWVPSAEDESYRVLPVPEITTPEEQP